MNIKSSRMTEGPVKEGETTKLVERVTGKVPSLGYLSLAVGSMAISAALAMFARRKEFANFVGLWAPSFLIIGLYNKLVKVEEELQQFHGSQARV